MGIETARRVQDRVREGLAELIRLVNDPATPTADVSEVLAGCKALGAQVSVLQADAAVVVAARERHGDCGVGVLAQAAGVSRQQAVGQVQTARSLQSMPSVRDAVEAGEISVANAKTLVRASGKTSAAQVDADAELLEKAAELSVEAFAKEAGRWAVKRQDDGGEGEYRRQRARRRLSFWDGDDGMVHLRGELDPVTGAKVRKRFIQESERLRRADLHSPGGERRSLSQRMADSLDTLTSQGSIYSKAENATNAPGNNGDVRARGEGSIYSKAEDATNAPGNNGDVRARGEGSIYSKAEDATNAPDNTNHTRTRSSDANRKHAGGTNRDDVGGAYGDESGAGDADREGSSRGSDACTRGADGAGAGGGGADREGGGSKCGCGRRPSADITIVQHLSADGTEAFAEVAGGEVIPPSVLEEYFCDARIKGVVFSGEGVPLWHGHAKRLATKAQMNALRARYGACGGCGVDMWICQGHHIEPVSEGGATNIDNMMLVCWACHQKIHHHRWRVVPDGRGLYTIAPPERIRHGPAHAPDPPPIHGDPPPRATRNRAAGSAVRPSGEGSEAKAPANRVDPARGPSAQACQPEPLFTLV